MWSAQYTAFGRVSVDQNSTVENNLRFPGQYVDAETGWHYNWWRYYNPETGRYLRVDPIGYAGGANLFVYVNGNAVSLYDYSGLDVVCHNTTVSAAGGGPYGISVEGGHGRLACKDDEDCEIECYHYEFKTVGVGVGGGIAGTGETGVWRGLSAESFERSTAIVIGGFLTEGGVGYAGTFSYNLGPDNPNTVTDIDTWEDYKIDGFVGKGVTGGGAVGHGATGGIAYSWTVKGSFQKVDCDREIDLMPEVPEF